MRLIKLRLGAGGASSVIRALNLPALTPRASVGSLQGTLASFSGLSSVSSRDDLVPGIPN